MSREGGKMQMTMTTREVRNYFEGRMKLIGPLSGEARRLAFAAAVTDLRRTGLVSDEVAARVTDRPALIRVLRAVGAWLASEAGALAMLLFVVPVSYVGVWLVDLVSKKPSTGATACARGQCSCATIETPTGR